jgi:hypothetical protein
MISIEHNNIKYTISISILIRQNVLTLSEVVIYRTWTYKSTIKVMGLARTSRDPFRIVYNQAYIKV